MGTICVDAFSYGKFHDPSLNSRSVLNACWTINARFTKSTCLISFSGKSFVGPNDIFATLSDIRKKLVGDRPREKLVHVVEKLHCRLHGEDIIVIRVSGSLILGTHFIVCGSGVQVEGMSNFEELCHDIASNRMGVFHEEFHMQPGGAIGSYVILKQELHILQQ